MQRSFQFDNVEAATAFLREQYLNPVNSESVADDESDMYPTFTKFEYSDFYSTTLFGKFKWEDSDGKFDYSYTLKFTRGLPTNYTYECKGASGEIEDTRKFSMTISYSAKISLPDGLPNADEGSDW